MKPLGSRFNRVNEWRESRTSSLSHMSVARRVAIEESADDDAPTLPRIQPVPPLDDHDAFVPFAFFPHIKQIDSGGPVPVAEMTALQRLFDDARSAFRVGDDGRPVPGSDLVWKPRRGKFSTYCYRRIIHACVALGGLRVMTILHTQTADIIEEAIGNVLFCLERLPYGWVTVRRRGRGPLVPMDDPAEVRLGSRLRFNGCRWDFTTAGDRASTASKRGRSGAIHILHASEVREFKEPDKLFAAVEPAAKMWRIAESNPPTDRNHWMAQEYRATRDGVGSWGAAHFFPWHVDPSNRFEPGEPEYETTMRADFPLPEVDAAAEIRLELDTGQKAFRRHWLCVGSATRKRLNRAEYPESPEDCFVVDGTPFLDSGALDWAEAHAVDPVHHYRVGAGLWVSFWVDPAEFLADDRRLVIGADTAELYGRDNTAIIGRCDETMDQVVMLHGVAAWHDVAGGLRDVLGELVDLKTHRYTLGIERNHGLGLIAACESPAYRLRLYYETIVGRDGAKSSRAGIQTTGWSRRRYMSRVSDSFEGSPFEESGEVRILRPTVPFQSKVHIGEARTMVIIDHKPQAAPGHKDDTVIADAIALDLIASGVTPPKLAIYTGGSPSAGASQQSRSQRRLARHRRRR